MRWASSATVPSQRANSLLVTCAEFCKHPVHIILFVHFPALIFWLKYVKVCLTCCHYEPVDYVQQRWQHSSSSGLKWLDDADTFTLVSSFWQHRPRHTPAAAESCHQLVYLILDRSYTAQHVQCLQTSWMMLVLFCVPWGSVLGRIVFLLFTTDLLQLVKHYQLHPHLYADDTHIFHDWQPWGKSDHWSVPALTTLIHRLMLTGYSLMLLAN